MLWTPMTRRAYCLILGAHAGQLDKGGHPILEHIVAVAEGLEPRGSTEMLLDQFEGDVTAALLHEVFEDTKLTRKDLIDFPLAIPADIVDAVEALTRQESETYAEYIQRVGQNPRATRVKISDLKHNMDLTRLGREITERDLSLLQRYQKAYNTLTAIAKGQE